MATGVGPQAAALCEPRCEFLHLDGEFVSGHILVLEAAVMSDVFKMAHSRAAGLGTDGLLQRRARDEGVDEDEGAGYNPRRASSPTVRPGRSPTARTASSMPGMNEDRS